MNYNYLRYFSVLAEVEHYTLAAARLGISQPSLSSAIHNLENDLGGVKLFEKVGRNIRLTGEGKFYKEKVDAALQELHTASMMLRDSRSSAPASSFTVCSEASSTPCSTTPVMADSTLGAVRFTTVSISVEKMARR